LHKKKKLKKTEKNEKIAQAKIKNKLEVDGGRGLKV